MAALFGANGYQLISGRSFRSTEAAAIDGLIWSKNPKLSNIEVRSILESTCKGMNSSGLGFFDGNGRVDASAAVNYQGSAEIKIISPHTNDGFAVGSKITVTGFALSTLFPEYKLQYVAYK